MTPKHIPLETIVQGKNDLALAPAVRALLKDTYSLLQKEFPALRHPRYVANGEDKEDKEDEEAEDDEGDERNSLQQNNFFLLWELPSDSTFYEDIAYDPEQNSFYLRMKEKIAKEPRRDYQHGEMLDYLRIQFQKSMDIYEKAWKREEGSLVEVK